IAPNDVVALRFPEDWMNAEETTATAQAEAPAPAAGGYMLASAGDARIDPVMFSPRQTYPTQMQVASVDPTVVPASQPTAVAPIAAAPAVAPKVEAKVETRPEIKFEPKPEAKPAAPTRAVAAAAPKPKPKKKDELFNDAQLASIKTRLKLTDYQ